MHALSMPEKPTPPAQKTPQFPGFARPEQNWFKLPNDWTDITAGMSSLAELKVVEYVLKHTWGYQEFGLTKQITTDEFMHGRKRKDGTRMDKGTGLISRHSVIDGLKKAVQDGYLIEDVDASDLGRVKKFYALRMQGHEREDAGAGTQKPAAGEPVHAGVQKLHPRMQNLHHRSTETAPRTEKDTLERKPFNGDRSLFRKLPDLDQPKAKTEYVARVILQRLGDHKSKRFYQLVAAKIAEGLIRQALAEIEADGAKNPGALFTHKMKQHALQQLKQRIGT